MSHYGLLFGRMRKPRVKHPKQITLILTLYLSLSYIQFASFTLRRMSLLRFEAECFTRVWLTRCILYNQLCVCVPLPVEPSAVAWSQMLEPPKLNRVKSKRMGTSTSRWCFLIQCQSEDNPPQRHHSSDTSALYITLSVSWNFASTS